VRLAARSAGLALAFAFVVSAPVSAQQVRSERGESSTQARVVGALVGAMTSFVVGGVIGCKATSGTDYAADVRGDGFWVGRWIGSAVLAPLTAHVFDGRRGSPWPGVAAGTAVTVEALATDSGPHYLSLPVLQVLSGVVLGRAPQPQLCDGAI